VNLNIEYCAIQQKVSIFFCANHKELWPAN